MDDVVGRPGARSGRRSWAVVMSLVVVLALGACGGTPPYRSQELTFAGAGVTLAGTLTVPEGPGPHPGVVMITGSGGQDRDSSGGGHRLFLVLADALTRAGVVVLRADDRGVGGSTGDLNTAGYDALVADVLAGVRLLKGRPDVDPARVGLFAHSEGGFVAPLAAGRGGPGEVAFTVLMGVPGVPGADAAVEQTALTLGAAGAPRPEIDRAVDAMRAIIDRLRAGDDAGAADVVRAESASIGIPADQAEAYLPALREYLLHDPGPALRALRIPVLALFGGKDLMTPPAQSERPMRAALAANPDATVQTFEGLNHLLQPATTGSPTEYAQNPVTVDPAVLDRVTGWVSQR